MKNSKIKISRDDVAGTPFKSIEEMKSYKDVILKEEWLSVERARVRRQLLMKNSNRIILSPLLNGVRAKFVGANGKQDHLVRVFLSTEDAIQVDIDNELRGNDTNGSLESLVRSLVESLLSGYLSVLGLKDESPFRPKVSKGS